MTDTETGRQSGTQVLRELWDASDASRAEVEAACGVTKTCRNMKHVNFDSMAEPGTDLGSAWREKLRREGKLSESGESLRDLVLGAMAGTAKPDTAPVHH